MGLQRCLPRICSRCLGYRLLADLRSRSRIAFSLGCDARRGPRLGASLGANLSGIRYFGDFERFDAISRVAAEKLREIEERFGLLLPA